MLNGLTPSVPTRRSSDLYFDAPFACCFLCRLRGFRWPSASPAIALSDFRAADDRHAPRRAGMAHPILDAPRSEEHTSELQSLMRISYAVFCLKKKTHI